MEYVGKLSSYCPTERLADAWKIRKYILTILVYQDPFFCLIGGAALFKSVCAWHERDFIWLGARKWMWLASWHCLQT